MRIKFVYVPKRAHPKVVLICSLGLVVNVAGEDTFEIKLRRCQVESAYAAEHVCKCQRRVSDLKSH